MKITDIKLSAVHVNHRGDWVFVHVLTDEGISGIGELKAGKNYDAQITSVRDLKPQLIGRDPRHIESIFAEFKTSDRAQLSALSAIDQALWDILGKSLGVPIHALLGGAVHNDIRIYANINRATTERTPEGFAENADKAVAQGFDAIKLAPFDGLNRNIDCAKDAQKGIASLEAVRKIIGPDADLLVDCHSRFSVKGALEVADAIRDFNMFWYEQPVPESDMEGCVKVKEECGLQIAGGEGRRLREGFTEVFEHQSMHIIMPDVKIIGGISELKKVGDMAAAWNIPTAPHGASGPVTVAAQVQVLLSSPNALILEHGWGEVPWRHELIQPAENIVNGRIQKTDCPGLGVELNPDILKAHQISV